MKKGLPFCIFLFINIVSTAQVKVQALLVENLTNPVGIDIAQPRFSWQLIGTKRNILQSAYEIKVLAGNAAVWNSGKINSDQSVHVAYKGAALQSGKKYTWQVRVWDNAGKSSAWSMTSTFQTAFFNIEDWKAKWIEAGFAEDPS